MGSERLTKGGGGGFGPSDDRRGSRADATPLLGEECLAKPGSPAVI